MEEDDEHKPRLKSDEREMQDSGGAGGDESSQNQPSTSTPSTSATAHRPNAMLNMNIIRAVLSDPSKKQAFDELLRCIGPAVTTVDLPPDVKPLEAHSHLYRLVAEEADKIRQQLGDEATSSMSDPADETPNFFAEIFSQMNERDMRRMKICAIDASKLEAIAGNVWNLTEDSAEDPSANPSTKKKPNRKCNNPECACTREPGDYLADTDRPWPTKDDNVVFWSNGNIKLGFVVRYDAPVDYYHSADHVDLSLDVIPSGVHASRKASEVYVVERGFGVGECVQRQPGYDHSVEPNSKMMGLVQDVRLTADVLVLPKKQHVIADLPIDGPTEGGTTNYLDPVSRHAAHNYILLDKWIGDARDLVYLVTLSYAGHRLTVRDGRNQRVRIERLDASDYDRPMVVGESVFLTLADLVSRRRVTWEAGELPAVIRRRRAAARRDASLERIRCVVLKVEPIAALVRWIMSPCCANDQMPPSRLRKEDFERLVMIDQSVNLRTGSLDRLRMRVVDEPRPSSGGLSPRTPAAMTRAVYFRRLHDEFASKFIKRDEETAPQGPGSFMFSLFGGGGGDASTGAGSTTRMASMVKGLLGMVRTAATAGRGGGGGGEVGGEGGSLSTFGEIAGAVKRYIGQEGQKKGGEKGEKTHDSDGDYSDALDEPMEVDANAATKRHGATPPPLVLRAQKSAASTADENMDDEEAEDQQQDNEEEEEEDAFDTATEASPTTAATAPASLMADQKQARSISTNSTSTTATRTAPPPPPPPQPQPQPSTTMTTRNKRKMTSGGRATNARRYPARQKKTQKSGAAAAQEKKTLRQQFGDEIVGEVLLTHTYCDVEWLDGSMTYNVPGWQLVPVDPDLDYENHLPGNLMARKDTEKQDEEFGIILRLNLADRTAAVRWYTIDRAFEEPQLKGDEECTLFDIMLHPTYYRPVLGQLVACIGRESDDLRDVIGIVERNLVNGKQVVRLLSSERVELWPTQLTILNLHSDDSFSASSYDEDEEDEDEEDEEEDGDEEGGKKTYAMASLSDQMRQLGRLKRAAHQLETRALDFVKTRADELRTARENGSLLEALRWRLAQEHKEEDGAAEPDAEDARRVARLLPLTTNGWLRSIGLEPFADDVLAPTTSVAEEKEDAGKAKSWSSPTLEAMDRLFVDALVIKRKIDAIETKTKGVVHGLLDAASKAVQTQTAGEGMFDLEDEDEGKQKEEPVPLITIDDDDDDVEEEEEEGDVQYKADLMAAIAASLADEGQSGEKKDDEDVQMADASERNKTDVTTPMEVVTPNEETKPDEECRFTMADQAPKNHKWYNDRSSAVSLRPRNVAREHQLLRQHLPDGMRVVAYADRLDLLSFSIVGPEDTPFESIPFYFDARLPPTYPAVPPDVHYHAFSREQLNPNLYQMGKVCTSLLGTWKGQGIETWNSQSSNLLQVLLSIQGLILVRDPYYNEAGYEVRKENNDSSDNARRYNEVAAINSLDYMQHILERPPEPLALWIRAHCRAAFPRLNAKIQRWLENDGKTEQPAYETCLSKGFLMTLRKRAAILSELTQKDWAKEAVEEEGTETKKEEEEEDREPEQSTSGDNEKHQQ